MTPTVYDFSFEMSYIPCVMLGIFVMLLHRMSTTFLSNLGVINPLNIIPF